MKTGHCIEEVDKAAISFYCTAATDAIWKCGVEIHSRLLDIIGCKRRASGGTVERASVKVGCRNWRVLGPCCASHDHCPCHGCYPLFSGVWPPQKSRANSSAMAGFTPGRQGKMKPKCRCTHAKTGGGPASRTEATSFSRSW